MAVWLGMGAAVAVWWVAWDAPVWCRLQWALWLFRQGRCAQHGALVERELARATDDRLKALLQLNRATSLAWCGAWEAAEEAFQRVDGAWLGDLHQLLLHTDRTFAYIMAGRLEAAHEHLDLLRQAMQKRMLPGEVRGRIYRSLALYERATGSVDQARTLLRAAARYPRCRLFRACDRWIESSLALQESPTEQAMAAWNDVRRSSPAESFMAV
ncbi:MAG TPA: hypothetical protein VGO93_30750 [Candidatus Xenobia bacterium]|jgi:hypothetical protein